MQIPAGAFNAPGAHTAAVAAYGRAQPVAIVARPSGAGSAVNGGELLFLALAACRGNDLYREAAARGARHSGPWSVTTTGAVCARAPTRGGRG